MADLILPTSLLEIDKEEMVWKLKREFVDWCDENFKEPYSFRFARSVSARVFSRYQSDCYMLSVCDDDAALTLMKHTGVVPGDPDEEVEENKAERELFR